MDLRFHQVMLKWFKTVIYSPKLLIFLQKGRTNFYDPGIAIPMFISSPLHPKRKNQVTNAMTSHLDLLPTFLDWFNISYPIKDTKPDVERNSVHRRKNIPKLMGKSLLPLLDTEPAYNNEAIFASHNFHEVTMSYPMRAVRTNRHKLIHNLNYKSSYPIDQDFYVSPTFQDILNRTINHQPVILQQKYYFNRILNPFFSIPDSMVQELKFLLQSTRIRNV